MKRRERIVKKQDMIKSGNMVFESWMVCEVFRSDGTWTIGYVDGDPAQWDGNMVELYKGDSYDIMRELSIFHDGAEEYIVDDREWVENISGVTREQVLHAIVTMDQNVLRQCNDGSGCDDFRFSNDNIGGVVDMIHLWINEEYENVYYRWTDDDIIEYTEGIYPKKGGLKRSLRKKSILVSDLQGETIDGYYVSNVNEEHMVDLDGGIDVKFVDGPDDGSEIIPTEEEVAAWSRILATIDDAGAEGFATDSGVEYDIYAIYDSSGLDYWFSEGEYFGIMFTIVFVEDYDLSREDLIHIGNDIDYIVDKCAKIAYGLEDLSVVDFVEPV